MGRIVFAGAMSHVLDPDYYDHACGKVGRRMVEEVMAEIRAMGDRCVAQRPDALIIVADDHLNAFSFNAVPAFCVRIGTHVDRMVQDEAEAFDKVLEGMPARYPLHEPLANGILERGMHEGFDLAFSWEAPLDHAFLSPLNTMYGDRAIPPLAPIWVNCFVAPQPTAARCWALGRHLARVVAASPWNVAIIGTGGLSHFPELALSRVGETDTVFDRKVLHWLGEGEHEPLAALTADELHKAGEHELLNWIVVAGAVAPARGAAAPVRAELRYFGELARINLTAVEWRLA